MKYKHNTFEIDKEIGAVEANMTVAEKPKSEFIADAVKTHMEFYYEEGEIPENAEAIVLTVGYRMKLYNDRP